VLALLALSWAAFGTEVEIGDMLPKSYAEELHDLAADMEEAADSMRDDYYGTRLDLDPIEERLDKLIRELEDTSHKTLKRARQAAIAQHGAEPKRGLWRGKPPLGLVIKRDAGRVKQDASSDWFKLPPSQRGEVIQAWASEMPVKWKSRLEAYFVSVAAEER